MEQQEKTKREWPDDVFVLGLFSYQLDGWADLIEGKGDKLDQVREDIFSSIKNREREDVNIKKKFAKSRLISFTDQRRYIVISTAPGASTAIYAGKRGKDLFVSWRTFIRPVLNWILLLSMVGISSFISFFAFVIAIASSSDSLFYYGFPFWDAIQAGFWAYVISLICEVFIVLFLGAQIRGYSLAYFFIEPTYFDADDIAAMSFSAHYSILRALDKAGIESSKLRLKREFKVNRRGDTV